MNQEMRIQCSIMWLPKAGNTSDEYEDAFSPNEDVSIDAKEFRCAVADGATESSFCREWAQLLVEGFRTGRAIDELRKDWQLSVEGKELPWYAEEKLQFGAYAALVVLQVNSDRTWEAKAVGDCCVMHLRADTLLCSFPLSDSESFNNSPSLLSSKSSTETSEADLKMYGTWEPGDCFLLLSDALACWALSRQDDTDSNLIQLLTLSDSIQFADLITRQRVRSDEENASSVKMRNDDVTLMRVNVASI